MDHSGSLAARLRRKRALARAVLFTERLLPKLLPVALLVATFLALTWFGYFRYVPAWLHLATLGGFALALAVLAARLRHAAWPQSDQADRMLEQRNGLSHQAIQVQADHPAGGGPVADALWREHRIRMARTIGSLQSGLPRPDIARFDRYGLRAIPVLLVVIAFAFSYSNRAGLLTDVVHLHQPTEDRPDVRIDAWVTPPAHTGRAPMFLTGTAEPAEGPLRIPQFSELTVRVTGGDLTGDVIYRPDGEEAAVIRPEQPETNGEKPEAGGKTTTAAPANAEPPQAVDNQPKTLRYKILRDGTLSLDGREWAFSVIPDHVPEIAFDGVPRRTVASALEISFIAKDDYGIQQARAEIVPVDEPAKDARPLYPAPEYRLDLPRRNARDAKGTTSRNLSEHPLAGKRVRITLVAQDAAGQEGRSQPQEMVLPARAFFEPLAAAVAEQRQTFALDANQLPRAIALNEALMLRPEETIPNPVHFLLIKSAQERMRLARNDDQLRETADYLWEIALGIEDGNLSLADRRLREAQQALSEALDRNASDEEIAKLMQELREAMQAYMQELARQAQKNGQMQQNAQQGQILRQQDLERMMDQIENLARSGARDQAQQMLSEMQRMLNNLQAGRRPQQQGQQSDAMRQQMDKLGKLMQEQQKLMDQTFNFDQALRDRMQRGDPLPGEEDMFGDPGDEGQQQQGQSPTDEMTEEELRQALKDLKAQQEALSKQLGELQKGLKDMGIEPGEGFGQAGREMDGAAQSLGKGQGEAAVGSQGRALEALRQGAQDMMNQMQAMGQAGEGQGQPQMGRNGRDPLGRERPDTAEGPDYDGRTRVPEEIDIQRAREILEEIRRRLGTGSAPVMERNYLERLLGIE
ncbi:TIGR02302 family protein [Rhizobium sp. DBTS2]|uniref:TIGR02302 family protein n=2 Tax=Mycoplana rhizolycopersici TaxID=2746702 RepID=A0ABX2Q7I4_9HYPH|nr:TIGR02302 family protein [Rhizobium rhizolycopersici]NVP53678.1 TIGR02302 family protein [Rhizobium rhizolycopersici]